MADDLGHDVVDPPGAERGAACNPVERRPPGRSDAVRLRNGRAGFYWLAVKDGRRVCELDVAAELMIGACLITTVVQCFQFFKVEPGDFTERVGNHLQVRLGIAVRAGHNHHRNTRMLQSVRFNTDRERAGFVLQLVAVVP